MPEGYHGRALPPRERLQASDCESRTSKVDGQDERIQAHATRIGRKLAELEAERKSLSRGKPRVTKPRPKRQAVKPAVEKAAGDLLTVQRVADLFGVHYGTAIKWIHRKQIGSVRQGGRFMIPVESVIEFAAIHEIPIDLKRGGA